MFTVIADLPKHEPVSICDPCPREQAIAIARGRNILRRPYDPHYRVVEVSDEEMH